MLQSRKLLFLSTALLAISLAGGAQAAGFQLKEQGAAVQGTSFAGATAKADDLSTLFFNPAGMMRLDGRTQMSLGGSYIAPRVTYSPETATPALGGGGQPNMSNSSGGDAGVGALVPNFYAMTEIAPDWRAGIAVTVPFGLSTEYNNDWVGRYYAIDSAVETMNINPSIAHRVSPQLSIGAGLQAQYIKARLTNAVNTNAIAPLGAPDGLGLVKGDDWGFGYTLGILWEPRQDTRIGLDYRSRIKHKLDGDLTMLGIPASLAGVPALSSAAATASVTTPDILSLGIAHEYNDRLTLLGEAAWTNWSLFDKLEVVEKGTGTVRQSVDENWKDTIFLSVGAEYKYNEKLRLRGGVAYDRAAVGTSHRTFRIPEADRYWVSAGFGYDISDSITWDVGYSHLFSGSVRVNETVDPALSGAVTGKSQSGVDIITTGVTFKF